MFGSNNPFGQSSTSPFGSPSVFGQNSATNNPFAPKPFGSSNPFGTQTGTSIFGGTSTGVFGASQSSSPFSSTTTFGASSTPAFGASSTPAFGAASTPAFGAASTPAFGAASTPAFGASSTPTFGASSNPAFGASSTPAFGSSSSPFGGSSVFGQKPSFGSFGTTSNQTSPFGNTSQPSQPSFGSSIFGSSTPFGTSSQPAFGATGSPAFGASSTPAFGATSAPAFGATSTPSFGSTTTPTFGSTNTAFGASNAPVFGSSSTPAFGVSSTPLFGVSSTPAFGASSTPSFGTPSTPAFASSSTPSFSFGSTPAFAQSTSAFGSSPFGTGSSPFGAQSSAFGLQSTTPSFATSSLGQSGFGGQRGGSRIAAYTPTTESDAAQAGGQAGKLESISAMPVYKDKSHEELRWEDYQLGDKGGPAPSAQSTGAVAFGSTTQPSPFGSPSTFGQSSASPFSSSMTSNLFGQKPSTFGSGFGATSGSTFTSSGFGSSFSTAPSIFSSSTSAFGPTSSALNFGSTPSGSTPSLFNSSQALGASSPFGSTFGSTQLFNTGGSQIGQTAFGQTTSLFGQSTTSAFSQANPFGTSSSFGGNMFPGNTTPFGQSTPSLSTSFQPAPPQTTSNFGFGNFGSTQTLGAGSGAPGMFSQSNIGLQSATQSSAIMQPVPVTNPFGTLPAMPQICIGQGGSAPSIQYGISSMPVLEKPAPVRISSLLTSRHLSQRRTKFPVRKYHLKSDALKVPFFSDDENTTTTPKADALFIPRENPRALVISPMEPWSVKASEKASLLKGGSNANGNVPDLTGSPTTRSNATDKRDQDSLKRVGAMEQVQPTNGVDLKSNGYKEDQAPPKEDSYLTLNGHRAGEAAIVYEHGADIEALMPKLRRSDYFTEPRIQELAAKTRAESGFLAHVKDFIVGRHGYGSIKFLGETDVRRLDLESLVEFNNREVIVYMDDNKKPPVGQGLNKPAEVTLLNIKCFDKKTGHQYTVGPKIEKYKEMLKKKAEDQVAEFISYNPIKGEWKFRVSHFSSYNFSDEDD